MIVGEHLSKNANDKKEVEPALKEIKETTGEHPINVVLIMAIFPVLILRRYPRPILMFLLPR